MTLSFARLVEENRELTTALQQAAQRFALSTQSYDVERRALQQQLHTMRTALDTVCSRSPSTVSRSIRPGTAADQAKGQIAEITDLLAALSTSLDVMDGENRRVEIRLKDQDDESLDCAKQS